MQKPEIRLLVSRCLLGDNVVWHGKKTQLHKNKNKKSDKNLETFDFRETLQNLRSCQYPNYKFQSNDFSLQIKLFPICPEVDLLKLRVPRFPLKIVSTEKDYLENPEKKIFSFVFPGKRNEEQEQERKEEVHRHHRSFFEKEEIEKQFEEWWCEQQQQQTEEEEIFPFDGFINKAKSPLCGHGDARIFPSVSSQTKLSKSVDGGFSEFIKNKTELLDSNFNIANEKQLSSSKQEFENFLIRCWEFRKLMKIK